MSDEPHPWHITARAVRRYQEVVPEASRDFDDAREELVALAGGIWTRYERNQDLAPSVTRTGAYQYRGGLPLRLLVVVTSDRQMVDVVCSERRRRPLARRSA